MNHTLLTWGSLAVFGAVAAGEAVLAVRAAPGTPVAEAATAFSALLVFGASLFALRDPDRFEPPAPWLAYLAAAGTLGYVATVLG
ncbi:MAG: hypothetical protein ABEJ43_06075 [Haloferacaceae archaeon]